MFVNLRRRRADLVMIQKRGTTAVKLLKKLKEEMRRAVETALAVSMTWIGVVAAGWVLPE